MAVSAGVAFVDVVPNTAGFSTALSAGVQKQSSGLLSSAKRLGTTLGLALGAGAVVGFAKSSFSAFLESEAVTNQLNAALQRTPELIGETTAAFQDQATALQNLTGYQDEEILKADTVLTRFQLTGDQIRDLIPLILDYARATGSDATSAALGIGRALLGNTRALKTLGIEFTATGDRTRDLATLMVALREKVGGAAEEFGTTLAGKIEIAKAKLDDFKEDIGQGMAGALLLLTGDVDGATAAFEGMLSTAAMVGHTLGGDFFANLKTSGDAAAGSLHRVKVALALGTIQPTLDWVNDLAAAYPGLASTSEEAAAAADQLAEAQRKVNTQLREGWSLANQAAGGLVGLVSADQDAASAQRDMAAAQRKVNTLTANGKKGTEAYRQAVQDRNAAELRSIQSQQNLEGQAQSLYAEFRKGNVTLGEAENRLRAQAAAAGLSAGRTSALVAKVDALYAADSKIPSDVRTNFSMPGLDDSLSRVQQIKAYIDSLHDKSVNIYVYTHYKQDI